MVSKVVKRIPATEAKTRFWQIVQKVAATRILVIVQTRGKDRVVIARADVSENP